MSSEDHFCEQCGGVSGCACAIAVAEFGNDFSNPTNDDNNGSRYDNVITEEEEEEEEDHFDHLFWQKFDHIIESSEPSPQPAPPLCWQVTNSGEISNSQNLQFEFRKSKIENAASQSKSMIEIGENVPHDSVAGFAVPNLDLNYGTKFEYLLYAPTTVGNLARNQTVTYLNQSQSYEIQLKMLPQCNNSIADNCDDINRQYNCLANERNHTQTTLHSRIRLGFVDRVLAEREREEIAAWRARHHGEAILEIDQSLSFGISLISLKSNTTNFDPNHALTPESVMERELQQISQIEFRDSNVCQNYGQMKILHNQHKHHHHHQHRSRKYRRRPRERGDGGEEGGGEGRGEGRGEGGEEGGEEIEIIWHPPMPASVFVRVNAVSTDFTYRQNGGERGKQFRLIVQTFRPIAAVDQKTIIQPVARPLDVAACVIKVFKAGGAQRKQRSDIERLNRSSVAQNGYANRIYQPSQPITRLTSQLISAAQNDHRNNNNNNNNQHYQNYQQQQQAITNENNTFRLKLETFTNSVTDSSRIETTATILSKSFPPSLPPPFPASALPFPSPTYLHPLAPPPPPPPPPPLPPFSASLEIDRFIADRLSDFSAEDLRRLSPTDLEQLLAGIDRTAAMRLHAELHRVEISRSNEISRANDDRMLIRNTTPLTIYVRMIGQDEDENADEDNPTSNDRNQMDEHFALILRRRTLSELREQICVALSPPPPRPPIELRRCHVIHGARRILVRLTNEVIAHFVEHSIYTIRLSPIVDQAVLRYDAVLRNDTRQTTAAPSPPQQTSQDNFN